MIRRFTTLYLREVRAFFLSPIAYVVMLFFLLVTGFTFTAGVSLLNRSPSDVTVLEVFFNTVLFWFGFVLIFPLITMRSFAEEFKLGTIETLMTAPVRDAEVVLAKFLGALTFYIILWLPTTLYFVLFEAITPNQAAQASGAYFGSYLLMLLMGMFYISVGLLASALTRSQMVAAVISFTVITLLFFIGLLSFIILDVSPLMRNITGYFSAIEHMSEFSRGLIDTRPVIFYLTMTMLVLYLTYHVFQYRRWKA